LAAAVNADLGVVWRSIGIPERLLLVGLPLTIAFGFLLAMLVFPSLDTLEMVLLAAIFAPTDAALGKPTVTSPDVPALIHESLNLESGFNDGICMPIVVILRVARRDCWIGGHWVDVQIVALAAACFAAAQTLGGSGFVACFVGGLLFGALHERGGQDVLRRADSSGVILALGTWAAFGAQASPYSVTVAVRASRRDRGQKNEQRAAMPRPCRRESQARG
jgi:sodium/hydrogen antiporter